MDDGRVYYRSSRILLAELKNTFSQARALSPATSFIASASTWYTTVGPWIFNSRSRNFRWFGFWSISARPFLSSKRTSRERHGNFRVYFYTPGLLRRIVAARNRIVRQIRLFPAFPRRQIYFPCSIKVPGRQEKVSLNREQPLLR